MKLILFNQFWARVSLICVLFNIVARSFLSYCSQVNNLDGQNVRELLLIQKLSKPFQGNCSGNKFKLCLEQLSITEISLDAFASI